MPDSSVNIIVVSKSRALASRVESLVEELSPRITWQKDSGKVVSLVTGKRFDLVILSDDATKGDESSYNEELVVSISEASPQSQILFLVNPKNVENVVTTLEKGAYQYVKQPVSDTELKMLIETALRDRSVLAAEEIETGMVDRFDGIIGRAPSMQKVYSQIRRAAESNIPVLITGETGIGKDLTAQAIHRQSQRAKEPFVSINLGALPTDLIASELFGHEKGSFSGAIKQHQGVFERAGSGTVFLDEIDCIEEKVRVSLLRVLDNKSFSRLGGSDQIKSAARLIAATNADLEELVEQGNFREDLFYRLDVFRITIPPLRRRPEDVPLLVQEFVAVFCRANDRDLLKISPEFLGVLQAYHWPGNVRELKSVIHRAVLMCDARVLKPTHLPARFREIDPSPSRVTFEIGTPLEEVERTMVLRALEATGNNRKEAAELLGISRRVIYNKLKKHKIE